MTYNEIIKRLQNIVYIDEQSYLSKRIPDLYYESKIRKLIEDLEKAEIKEIEELVGKKFECKEKILCQMIEERKK